ncbi:MAG: DUF4426 domain-containing protein [Pseudomonadota bacterium]
MFGKKRISILLLALAGAGCGGPGADATIPTAEPAGETSRDIGDYVVHFSAQSTDQIPTDVAQAYNIVRSKNRAMLNVSVVREADGQSVAATVEVKTVNLTGQLKNVKMQQVNEQDAVYYIGQTPVAHRETLVFDIKVTPEGTAASSDLRFTREFYTDQ